METKNIYQKLSEFQSIVGKLRKDQTNPFFKSKYADINTVLDVIREPLKKVGLVVTQSPMIKNDGTPFLMTLITSSEKLDAMLSSEVKLITAKEDMQGLGSAITYARRYALVSMLGLEQEDDDGNRSVPSKDLKDFDPATEIVGFGKKYKNKKWVDMNSHDLNWIINESSLSELIKSKAKKTLAISNPVDEATESMTEKDFMDTVKKDNQKGGNK